MKFESSKDNKTAEDTSKKSKARKEVKETKFSCEKCGHVWYVSKAEEIGKASHQCTACTNPCCFFLLSPQYKDIYTDRCPKCNSKNIDKELFKYKIKTVNELIGFNKVSALQKIVLKILSFYQKKLSPILQRKGVRCRFAISCSDYSKIVFSKYGILKGLFFTVKRLLNCRPSNTGSCIDYPCIKIKN